MLALLSQAFASATDASVGGALGTGASQNGLASMLPFALVLAVFYFLLIRPQQKRVKMHQQMVTAMKKGDRVITGGGILGTITKIESDDMVAVQIADAVTVQVARSTIVTVLADAEMTEPKKGRGKASTKQVANDN